MNTPTKLGAYAAGLAAVFALALGAGRVTGPVTEPVRHTAPAHSAPAAGHAAPAGTAITPGGLQTTQNGYTLVPRTGDPHPKRRADFEFTITGPGGRPVTRFDTVHEKQMHFIVLRRDLAHFQHLHPEHVGDGVWSVPLTLPAAGTYRAFADFKPAGAAPLTLGTDVFAGGDFAPRPLPPAVHTSRTGDYTVAVTGGLTAGGGSELKLTVRRNGAPVTDLQPYLGAYGHLVAVRHGDLAYLHVHPEKGAGAGPTIAFHVEVPAAGSYRLFLDFRHQGRVHTAAFTMTTTGAAPPPSGSHESDGHGH